jgi:hypothetical protein
MSAPVIRLKNLPLTMTEGFVLLALQMQSGRQFGPAALSSFARLTEVGFRVKRQ